MRYPRGSGVGVALDTQWQDLPIGKAEVLRTGKDVCFWAIGSMVQTALDAAELLEAQGISAGVVNMRFAKPLDVELLREHAQSYGKIITLEEGVLAGGVGSAILEELNEINCWSSVKYVASAFLTNLLCMATKAAVP